MLNQTNSFFKTEKNFSASRTVLFDTCSVLEGDSFAECMKTLLTSHDEQNKIIVLSSVIQELRYLLDSDASTCREKARQALADLQLLGQAKAITIAGNPEDAEQADRSILKWITVNRMRPHFHDKILVVTQDKQLAADVLMLNHLATLPNLPAVSTRKIGYRGKLVSLFENNPKNHVPQNNVRDILKTYGVTS